MRIPRDHLLRRIDVFTAAALADLHHELADHYSHTGRPSIDPELLVRMLIVGYCYGIRSERRLCEEVADRLTFRWFCRLDLDDRVPDHDGRLPELSAEAALLPEGAGVQDPAQHLRSGA